MSLTSTRPMVFAVGLAACGLLAAARPVRSWASQRGVSKTPESQSAQVGKLPPDNRGQYPDVDIQLIDDFSSTTRKANPPMVRIHMDIVAPMDADFSNLKAVLANTHSSADDIYKAIKDATKLNDGDKTKPGLKVLNAAVGK